MYIPFYHENESAWHGRYISIHLFMVLKKCNGIFYRRPMSMSSGTYRPRQETGGENPGFTPTEEIYSWSLYNTEASTSRPTMPDRWQNLDFANQCNGRQREHATAESFTVETSNSFRYIPGNQQEGSDNSSYVYNGAMPSENASIASPLYDSAPPPYSRYPEANHTSSHGESEQGSRRLDTAHSQGRSRAPRSARRTDTSQNIRRPPTPHNSIRLEMQPDSQVEISRRQETREQSIREDTTIRWI